MEGRILVYPAEQTEVDGCSPKFEEGDVMLLRDKFVHRNQWPLAVIKEVLPSPDEVVRKVIIRLVRDGRTVTYTSSVNELILLVNVP